MADDASSKDPGWLAKMAALLSGSAPAQATVQPQLTMSQQQFGNPHANAGGIVPVAPQPAPPGGIAGQAGGQAGAMQRYQNYATNAMANGVTPMPMAAWAAQQPQ